MTTTGITKQAKRAALSGYLGTTLEYYDFVVYGALAALVFNEVFFSNMSATTGTLAALATGAAGYVARLAGAVTFGHFGDRIGRKKVLMVTLVVMGLASCTIGLLPTQAQIGAAAPLLLLGLRLLQGFAVGGEFGGAVLMTSEHAQRKRRGLFSSTSMMGVFTGSALSYITVLILTAVLSDEQLVQWGWRLPFLFGFALLILTLFIRAKVAETPAFEAENQEDKAENTSPFIELLRTRFGTYVKAVGLQLAGLAGQGVFFIFLLAYAQTQGYSRMTTIAAATLGSILGLIMTPLFAAFSDRVGRRPIVLWSSLGTVVLAFPMFWLIHTGNPTVLIASVGLYSALVMTPVLAVAPAMLTELFPTKLRYTGVSMTYQTVQIIGPGLGPVAAASIIAAAGGSTTWVSLALVGCGAISVICLFLTPETRSSDITEAAAPRDRHDAGNDGAALQHTI